MSKRVVYEINVMVYFQPGERMRMMYYSRKSHRHTQKKIRVLLSGVEPKTFRLLVRIALPLSYRRLVGAEAIKLGSWDKHPAYC